MKQVLIRTDANIKIGTGHFYRCLSLAGYLKDTHKITFAMDNPSFEIEVMLKLAGYELVKLFNEDELKKNLRKDMDLVLDGYHFDYSYQKKIKPFCKRLFYIDDLNEGKFCADYVINHSISSIEEDYSKIPEVEFLLGYDYILLREEFLKPFPNLSLKEKVENITICMGGADKDNITLKLAIEVLKKQLDLNLNLIFGIANINFFICKEKLSANKNVRYFSNLTAQEMCELLRKTDIIIAPASGISHEAISLGIPLITGVTASNQEKNAKKIGEIGLGLNLGWFVDLTKNQFKFSLDKLLNDIEARKKITYTQKMAIDKKSKIRLNKIFNK